MKETIQTTVVVNDRGMELRINFEDDVISFVDERNKVLFSCDWTANLAPIFERALEIWPLLEE